MRSGAGSCWNCLSSPSSGSPLVFLARVFLVADARGSHTHSLSFPLVATVRCPRDLISPTPRPEPGGSVSPGTWGKKWCHLPQLSKLPGAWRRTPILSSISGCAESELVNDWGVPSPSLPTWALTSVWRQSPSGVPLQGQAQEAESAPPIMGHRRPGPSSASPSS